MEVSIAVIVVELQCNDKSIIAFIVFMFFRLGVTNILKTFLMNIADIDGGEMLSFLSALSECSTTHTQLAMAARNHTFQYLSQLVFDTVAGNTDYNNHELYYLSHHMIQIN